MEFERGVKSVCDKASGLIVFCGAETATEDYRLHLRFPDHFPSRVPNACIVRKGNFVRDFETEVAQTTGHPMGVRVQRKALGQFGSEVYDGDFVVNFVLHGFVFLDDLKIAIKCDKKCQK